MKKRLTALIMATMFFAGTVATGFAVNIKCEVKSVDGTTVVLDCGSKAKKFKVGDEVKVKVKVNSSQAVEGC